MSYSVTQDFRAEYEVERTKWLWRRFLWYAGVLGAFSFVKLFFDTLSVLLGGFNTQTYEVLTIVGVSGILQVGLFSGAFFYVYGRSLRQEVLLRMVFWLTVVIGVIALLTTPYLAQLEIERVIDGMPADESPPSANLVSLGIWMSALGTVFVTHFIASLFIPWTPREAIRPLIPLLLVFALVVLVFGQGSFVARTIILIVSPLVGIPGVLVCWWRHSRFRSRFYYRMLRGRYGELQRELLDARGVHEGLFPKAILDGPVRMHYRYQPMHQIGGDYLYAFLHQPDGDRAAGVLNIVLIDVTGHGVKAALTVNRVYGELERIFAEDPNTPPGQLLVAINRYVRLTLAKHSIYATALSMRIDPSRDTLQYASAGHPPAFVVSASGKVNQLDSTAPLLGVFPRQAYDPDERTIPFRYGDTVIAYTDGAIDTANEAGERLRSEGILRVLASSAPKSERDGRWASTIADVINAFQFGPPLDDTLLVEVWRPIEPAPAPLHADESSRPVLTTSPSA